MNALRIAIRTIGEVLITAGLIVLLYVVWQLGFLAVVEGKEQAGVVASLEDTFAQPAPVATPTKKGEPPVITTKPPRGEVFAILRVPRLGGPTWAKPVYEGTDPWTLTRGLGRYSSTALPGQIGNFAVAGHRAGHGNPLIDIDAIRVGDVMIVETREGYFVYKAKRTAIVAPTRVDVVAPVPEQPGVEPTQRLFTLTTCDPRYGSTNRYIVFATFDKFIERADGVPRALLADPAKAR